MSAPPSQRSSGMEATPEHDQTAPDSATRRGLPVTMVGALPPWRGVAPYTRHLVEGLEQVDGVDLDVIDFVSLYPPLVYPGGEPRERDAGETSFSIARVRRLLAWYNPLSWLQAGLSARDGIVHAQWWTYVLAPVYVTVLGLARLRGRRIVLTLHNIVPHDAKPWQRWLYRAVFRLADHFVVHSDRNAGALVESYPRARGRVSVVPLGMHTVESVDLTPPQAKAALCLPQERPVVLAFGNIRPYKGIDVLLRAFRRVLDAGQDATLVIAGQPWSDFEEYQAIIDQERLGDNVRTFLEFVPEERVGMLFSAADIAVFPYTQFEAQSAAASMAISFGLPLVVTDVGGLPELVDDARAVARPGDVASLAQAIEGVLASPEFQADLAAGSTRRAGELGWDAIALQTADVYRRLLDDAA